MTAGEFPVHELSSAAVVERMEADISARIDRLRSSSEILPTLAILSDNYEEGTPTYLYINLKQQKAKKLGMAAVRDPRYHKPDPAMPYIDPELSYTNLRDRISYYNDQPGIHGMIVQLPLITQNDRSAQKRLEVTDALLNGITPEKDVDGLGAQSPYHPATPLGILSLLEANDVDYRNRPVVIRGLGRLVGSPLLEIMKNRGAQQVDGIDLETPDHKKHELLNAAEVIITAVGDAGALRPDTFTSGVHPKVLVDAGATEQKGGVVGDVSDELRQWATEQGWTLTPKKGGAGRLTVLHLLDNVVTAAENATPVPVPQPRRPWTLHFQKKPALQP